MQSDLGTVYWFVSGLVLIAACLRFLWFSRKRRRQPIFQPFEVQIIDLLAVLITGKRTTGITWKRIDFVVLSALVVVVIMLLPPAHRSSSSQGTSSSISSITSPIQ